MGLIDSDLNLEKGVIEMAFVIEGYSFRWINETFGIQSVPRMDAEENKPNDKEGK